MRDCRGSALIEFAIIFPIMLLVMVGSLDVGLVMLNRMQLEFATEAAARCYAINQGPPPNNPICATAAAAAAYAAGLLPTIKVSSSDFSVLTIGTDGCVTGNFNYVPFFLPSTIPLGTRACYPIS